MPAIRVPFDSVLTAPWSAEQRARLTAAADEARWETRRSRGRLAAFHLCFVASLIGVLVWLTILGSKCVAGASPAGAIEIMIGGFMLAFGLQLVAMILWHLRLALRELGSREWFAPPRGSRGLVRVGFCAACLADLHEERAEADGCTVCFECGAAWRAPADRQS